VQLGITEVHLNQCLLDFAEIYPALIAQKSTDFRGLEGTAGEFTNGLSPAKSRS
jgi:hypothetical protein